MGNVAVRIKGIVNNNPVLCFCAERVLNGYVILRKLVSGSYTKYHEDKCVAEYLSKTYGITPEKTHYYDIGANDYRRGNNSYLFYSKGASGVLVEANPLLCKKLEKKRTRDQVLNVAIGSEDIDAIDFYVLSLSTRSSMDKDAVEESVKNGLKVIDTVSVPCVSINSLFEKYQMVPDFLSIDIEGMDYKSLRSIDFEKYKIKVIVAEADEEPDENGVLMNEYMEKSGYCVYKKFPSNTVYVLKEKVEG